MSSITLDPIWNGNPVIQRSPTNTVRLNISGRFTGTPLHIEARIEFAGTGLPYLDWFTLVLQPDVNRQDNTFTGAASFPAQTATLRLKVRFSDDPAVIATSANFATGDVFLLKGQSNMERFVGVKAGVQLTRTPASFICVPDIAEATALGMSGTTAWQSTSGDGLITLANRIGAETGYPVGFIFLARGGVPLVKNSVNAYTLTKYLLSTEGHIRNFPDEAFLTKTLNFVRQAMAASATGVDFRGIFDLHGEADSAAGLSAALYKAGKTKQYHIFRAPAPRKAADDIPFFVSPVGKFGAVAGVNTIGAAVLAWANETPGAVACADHYDLPTIDGVHLAAADLVTVGRRFADAWSHHLNPQLPPGLGPYIESASRAGAIITAQINLNGHDGVEAENPAAPLTGFEVSSNNFSTLRTISNTTLAGTLLTITLSSDPAAAVQLRYRSTADGAADNLIYTTNVATGDALGFPLTRTTAPITVS